MIQSDNISSTELHSCLINSNNIIENTDVNPNGCNKATSTKKLGSIENNLLNVNNSVKFSPLNLLNKLQQKTIGTNQKEIIETQNKECKSKVILFCNQNGIKSHHTEQVKFEEISTSLPNYLNSNLFIEDIDDDDVSCQSNTYGNFSFGRDNNFGKSLKLQNKDVRSNVESTKLGTNIENIGNNSWFLDNWFKTWPVQDKKVCGKVYPKRKRERNIKECICFKQEQLELVNQMRNHDLLAGDKAVCFLCRGCANMNCTSTESSISPECGIKQVSLDTLLESIPLVYDPSTKQLCLGVERNYRNTSFRKTSVKKESYNIEPRQCSCDNMSNNRGSPSMESSLKSHLDEDDDDTVKESLLKLESQSCVCDDTCLKPPNIIKDVGPTANEDCIDKSKSFKLHDCNRSIPGRLITNSVSLDRPQICDNSRISGSLPRVSTTTSLSYTDTSSFSSLSSLNTEVSINSASDSAVCLVSDGTSFCDHNLDGEAKLKKRGLTDFFSRNLFPWRSTSSRDGSLSSAPSSLPVSLSISSTSCSTLSQSSSSSSLASCSAINANVSLSSSSGTTTTTSSSSGTTATSTTMCTTSTLPATWRLFSRSSSTSPRSSSEVQTRHSDVEAGTVGLIMETRPSNLPAKTDLEQQRHHNEYLLMLSAAKKKEVREAKERRKTQAAKVRLEQQLAVAVATWNNDIIPKWESIHGHKKCRELWWQGLPSCVRGRVWKLAVGNQLNITPQLYAILVQRSVDKLVSLSECGSMISGCEETIGDTGSQEATIDLIRLDVSRTLR